MVIKLKKKPANIKLAATRNRLKDLEKVLNARNREIDDLKKEIVDLKAEIDDLRSAK